jgi:hypothetical protein
MRTVALAAGLVAVALTMTGCSVSLPDFGSGAPVTLTPVAAPPSPDPSTEELHDSSLGRFDDSVAVMVPVTVSSTPAIKAKALRFAAKVRRIAQRKHWADPKVLARDGYVPMTGFDLVHYYNKAYLQDGRQFDPRRPEFVMIDQGHVLGVMFSAESNRHDLPPPPIAPYLRWHYHRYLRPACVTPWFTNYWADSHGRCHRGDHRTTTSPLMTHVWLVGSDPFMSGM